MDISFFEGKDMDKISEYDILNNLRKELTINNCHHNLKNMMVLFKALNVLIVKSWLNDYDIVIRILVNLRFNFDSVTETDKELLTTYLTNIFNYNNHLYLNGTNNLVNTFVGILEGKPDMSKFIFDILVKMKFVFNPDVVRNILYSRNLEVKMIFFNNYPNLINVYDDIVCDICNIETDKFTSFLTQNLCKISKGRIEQYILCGNFKLLKKLADCGYVFTTELLELVCQAQINIDTKMEILKLLLSRKVLPNKKCFTSLISSNQGYNQYNKFSGSRRKEIMDLLLFSGYVPTYDDVLLAASNFVSIDDLDKYGIEIDDRYFEICIKNNFYPFTYDATHATLKCLQLECCKHGNLPKIRELVKAGIKLDFKCLKNSCMVKNNLATIKFILENSELKLTYELTKYVITQNGNTIVNYIVEKMFNLTELVKKEKNEILTVSNTTIKKNNTKDMDKINKKTVNTKDVDSDDGDPKEPEPEIYKKKTKPDESDGDSDNEPEPEIYKNKTKTDDSDDEKYESSESDDEKPKKINKNPKKITKSEKLSESDKPKKINKKPDKVSDSDENDSGNEPDDEEEDDEEEETYKEHEVYSDEEESVDKTKEDKTKEDKQKKRRINLIKLEDIEVKKPEKKSPSEIVLNKNEKIIVVKIIKKNQNFLKEIPSNFNYREKHDIKPEICKLLKIRNTKKSFIELRKSFTKYLVDNKLINNNVITIPRDVSEILLKFDDVVTINMENTNRLIFSFI